MQKPNESSDLDWPERHFQEILKRDAPPASSLYSKVRQRSFEAFQKMGFPHQKAEEWKYTRPGNLVNYDYALPASDLTFVKAPKTCHPDYSPASLRIVFVSGTCLVKSTEIEEYRDKLQILTFKELIDGRSHPLSFLALKHLEPSRFENNNSLALLNSALFSDGVVIVVKPNTTIETPILITHLISDNSEPDAVHRRILLVLGENSKVNLVEHYSGNSSITSYNSTVVETRLAENSHLSHTCIFDQEGINLFYRLHSLDLKRNSSYSGTVFSFSGSLIRNEVMSEIQAPGVDFRLAGLNVLSDSQHVDNTSSVRHVSGEAQSDQLFKGIYSGTSKGIFSGRITVVPDAQHTNALQSNRSILLSKDASSYSRPQLVINADDVRCTHGVAVGELDQQQLFYLRSRGLSEEKAKKVLLEGFGNEILEKVQEAKIKSFVRTLFTKKLTDLSKEGKANEQQTLQ